MKVILGESKYLRDHSAIQGPSSTMLHMRTVATRFLMNFLFHPNQLRVPLRPLAEDQLNYYRSAQPRALVRALRLNLLPPQDLPAQAG